MRPSKREALLRAALGVIEDQGVAAVTFESVSAKAGITKGGLLYHFPTKEQLIAALHEHVADRWHAAMRTVIGREPEEATPFERLRAYVTVSLQSPTRAEIQLMLEPSPFAAEPDPWQRVTDRWLAAPAELGTASTELLLARFAADGLWMSASFEPHAVDADARAKVAARMLALIHEAETREAAHSSCVERAAAT